MAEGFVACAAQSCTVAACFSIEELHRLMHIIVHPRQHFHLSSLVCLDLQWFGDAQVTA